MIPNEIFEYLKTQRIGVLALEMPDGSPHAATVHFAHTEEPFIFYFETRSNTRKAEALLGGKPVRASFVIGVDEAAMKTFQVDGMAELLKPEEGEAYENIYLGKFPEKIEKSKLPEVITFKLTVTWWRFTDFKSPQGRLILTSE